MGAHENIDMSIFIAAKKTLRELGDIDNVNIAWINEDDAVIYAKISEVLGDNDEFSGGEYIAEILLCEGYPRVPPHVKFLTPNGITMINIMISINRFGYHSEGYTPESGAYGVAMLLPAILIQWKELGPGIGLITTPNIEEIRGAAAASREYNNKYLGHIIKLMNKK